MTPLDLPGTRRVAEELSADATRKSLTYGVAAERTLEGRAADAIDALLSALEAVTGERDAVLRLASLTSTADEVAALAASEARIAELKSAIETQTKALGFAQNGRAASEAREKKLREYAARLVYERWRDQPGYVPWVPGGNSIKQDDARRIVDAALSDTQQEQTR